MYQRIQSFFAHHRMKFMQRALEKQRKQAQAELAEIKKQLENGEHVVSILCCFKM